MLVCGQCLPLALRRVWPVPVLICSGVLRDLYDGLKFGFAPLPLAPAIAFATVADRSRPVIRWITVVASAGGVAYSQALPGHNQPYDAIVQASIFGAAWAIGTLSRHRRAALAAAALRAARAEASLDVAAAGAAAAERGRIARELHDVVAHHVSLIAVQAEAVGALLPARPAEASRSADAIAATARQAMTELRRLLGVLRFNAADQDPSSERTRLTPAPSLSRLDDLLTSVRASGLPVTCAVSGAEAALPPGVDLTAYRIVQEALTNALRHAPGSAATVALAYEDACVSVAVTNTSSQAPAAHATSVTCLRRRLRPGRDRRAGCLLRRLARPRPGRRRRFHRDRPIAADVTAADVTGALRVLVADDQELVRAGFRLILEASGFVVVGEAPDGAAAVELAALHRRTWC